MQLHHVLCIHGIGNHSNKWVTTKDKNDEESVSDQFFGLLKKYPVLKSVDPDSVKLHSIHYDDEILKIFANWADQAKALKDGLASSPLLKDQASEFTKIIDDASDAQQDASFKFTHLLDLLLFAGSPSIQDRLVTYVGRQIIELINSHPADNFSLVGHSMGAAMAHKVVQALFNEGVLDANGVRQTLKGDFRFQCVTMVANTSYSLSRDRATHYTGVVRPSRVAGKGCCLKWINVNHRLDPVGLFMPFDFRKDPKWLEPKVELSGFHRDIRLSRISKAEIHALSHYLRDPSFHIPLFELLFGRRFTTAQRDDALKEFDSTTPEGQFKSLKSHLETLDVSKSESFLNFYAATKKFLDVIKQFG
jgi:hypothetical protein